MHLRVNSNCVSAYLLFSYPYGSSIQMNAILFIITLSVNLASFWLATTAVKNFSAMFFPKITVRFRDSCYYVKKVNSQ